MSWHSRGYYSDMVHKQTCVYRLFDASGRLLYVGLSVNPRGRISQHHRKDWWPDVADWAVEWFAGREAAKAAEREAIATEDPVHNIMRPMAVQHRG